MTQNKLQLNNEKTSDAHRNKTKKKCPLFVSTPLSLTIPQSLSLTLSKTSAFSLTARCPWKTSSVKPRSCYYQLCQISSVRKYFFTKATVKLVTSLLLSHLDYCSSLLSSLPALSVHSLHRIQNCAARLIPKNTHVKLILTHFCFNFSTGSQSNKEFNTRQTLSAINYGHCSVFSL